ncbi:putative LuxR-family transcriptional regulator [Actinoplanes missouriensis 431]|uniref:Putative LuxR-family transcriptional regulator n=1 Tax=Actinoplanes missouriensis (strain ATCC 14538 / DSM 43046 / CBS 188.64 / JCM 3121 / NBRC 102363 / NCIMB 12654 / NRRL B-3342 / UNCC 431) TaxID=512565 RepID=I0H815_ACTM4|nr:LuxR C-terminal-related transcriptional regulator [Actinoplanes missouriensis]BAL89152.1 putative LuxR-family transcriptional regulator [Actinoplanes missouriensis 431]
MTLTQLLDRGRGAAAVVATPGLGISTVLDATAAEAARRGVRVVRATGHADETDLAGLGVHQLLQPVRERAGVLPGPLRAVATAALALRPHAGHDLETTLLTGARALLGGGPVLVVVDDLHLFDPLSVRIVAALVNEPPRGPVMILLGVRRHRAEGLLPAGIPVVPLEPLPDAAAARLLARQPGAPAGRERLRLLRLARGNPRAIVELARSGAMTSALRRYAAVTADPDVLSLARLVSVAGALPITAGSLPVVAGTLPTAAGVSPQVLARAVADGLLETGEDGVRFTDPLAGIATYYACPAAERDALHRRLAAILPDGARHLAAVTATPDDALAAALEELGHDPELLERAARLSADPAAAARRHTAALMRAGAMGQTGWVRGLYLAAPDVPQVAAEETALALCRAGRQREAMDVLLDSARRHPPSSRLDRLALASAAAYVARLSGLEQHRITARGLYRDVPGDDHPAIRAAIRGSADPYGDQPPAVAAPGYDRSAFRALLLAHAAEMAWQSSAADALRPPARDALRDRDDDVAGIAELCLPLTSSLIDAGEWDEAERLLDDAQARCDRADLPLLEVEIAAMRSRLAGLRGDGTAARELAETAWSRVDLHQNLRAHAHLRQALGIAVYAEGNYEMAYQHHRSLFGADGRPLYPDFTVTLLLGAALTAYRAGRVAEVRPFLAAATGPDSPRRRIRLAHISGLLADADAGAFFAQAVDDPAGDTWTLERAMSRLFYGTWLRRQRRPAEARSQLTAALETFERLGAQGFAASTRIELSAAGQFAGPPGRESPLLGRLSPQQRHVVLLAAEGLRNSEIAERLQVSPRTVGTHLYNAYPKLGISGRRELGSVLAG